MNLLNLAFAYFRSNLILPLGSLGIALGIGVLFTVISVFNGFVLALESNIKQVYGDLTVSTSLTNSADQQQFLELFDHYPQISVAHPQLHWFGLIGRRGSRAVSTSQSADLAGVLLIGSDGDLPASSTPELSPMVMGQALADELGIKVGEIAEIISQRPNGRHAQPVRHSFQLTGTNSTGRFDQDIDRVLIDRQLLSEIIGLQHSFTTFKLSTSDGTDITDLRSQLLQELEAPPFNIQHPSYVKTWRDLGGTLLRAAEDQKGTLAIVFGFIVIVAAYQLIATLLLLISDKRKDIGILGAIGASPSRIRTFFLLLSCIISTCGICLGLLIGFLLNSNLHTIELLIGGGKPIFLPEVYKFDKIPVQVEWQLVWVLIAITYLITLLFSLIPAVRATNFTIVKALQRR
ncbi:MAG: ABC transporter permease [Planctomycetota bacterium]|nr:ABC transporter permease [Planctomycetota bacterium]